MTKTLTWLLLVSLVVGASLACERKSAASGELTRGECVSMVIKIDGLRNRELGRANSVDQRVTVDRCMEKGTRAQFECVEFANTGAEVARCDELAR